MKKIIFISLLLMVALLSNAQEVKTKEVKLNSSQDIIGDWSGVLDPNGLKLKLVLHIVASDHGFSSTMDSPDQSAFGIPVATTEYTDSNLKLEISSLNASFEGTLESELFVVGVFTQNGQSFDLSLKKGLIEKVERIRPQEPKKPYSNITEEQSNEVKPSETQEIIGDWSGVLDPNGMKLKLVLHIVTSDQGFSSTMDSPDQSAFGIPVATTEFTDSNLKLEISSLNASFEGTLESELLVVGVFTQNGQSFDLTIKKGMVEKVELKRPQEPVKPYPYLTKDIRFENKDAGIHLSGSLTLPSNGDKFPAVILVSGSGPQNRDEELLGHKPFLVISDYLTRKGIAVLRYDERGVAQSEGDFTSATTFDFAKDAEAAFEYLKTRPEIDAQKIGIIGHSEGGLIAQILASKHSDLGFIVSMAGPGMRGDQLSLLQKKKMETQMNVLAIVVESGQKIFGKAYEMVIQSESNDAKLKEQLTAHFKAEYGITINEEQVKAYVGQLTNPWFYAFFKIDPANYLSKIKTPVLALNGTKDLQVSYVENLNIIQKQLEQAGNTNVTIKSFKGLNHLFQECETGALDEYGKIEQTISPKVLKYMSKWIVKQTKK